MQKTRCPACGNEITPGAACPGCERGAPAPSEVAGWVIERPSPDVLAWAAQTFDEAEYLAALREAERGGGHRFEDFIDEVERIAHGDE